MSEIERWSGNDTTDITIGNNGFKEIIYFARQYKKIYVFGNGHIGKSIQKYLRDSGIEISGVVTSEKLSFFDGVIDEQIGLIIGVGDNIVSQVLPQIKSIFNENQIYIPDAEIRESIGNILDPKIWEHKFWINVYVTNKCNLSCKSCSAFAPICKPDFYELEEFKKDIDRVACLGFAEINEFKFTGAEAMLHPNILEMLEYTRFRFKDKNIQVYSNGIFIKNYSNDKLKKLSELGVVLVITEYPLPNLNLREAYRKLDQAGVLYNVIYSDEQKFFSKRPLRFERDVPKERYIECPRYKMCNSLFLFRGKFYKCIYAISSGYVNETFGKALEIREGDYVDIYNTDVEKVFEFATSRLSFCDYCSPIEEKVPWGISKKTIDEWS